VLAVAPGDSPPAAKALVLLEPVTVGFSLESFKSFTSVQLVPFHNSVAAVTGVVLPPANIAEVDD